MSIRALATQSAAVGVPVGDAVTNNSIITALDLETMVFLSLTYGAWFKIIGFVSIMLVIIVNIQTIRRNWQAGDSRKSAKRGRKR